MQAGRNFTFSLLKHQESTFGLCEDQALVESEKNGSVKHRRFKQYEVDDLSNIWWRVACVNVKVKGTDESLIGPTGHVERCSVWLHLLSAVIYAAYFVVRPALPTGQTHTTSSDMAATAIGATAITFFSSTVYHVYSANEWASAWTRQIDYGGIYLGIAATTLSDLSIVVPNLSGISRFALVDPVLAVSLLWLFFLVRRTRMTTQETRLAYLSNKCALGLARSTNVDLEHSSLRAASGWAAMFLWIIAVPLAFANLENDCAWVFSVSRFIGAALIVFGMSLDNLVLYPDAFFENSSSLPGPCACSNNSEGPGGGWIMTSHAWWHVISFCGTALATAATEYCIANSEVLAEGP